MVPRPAEILLVEDNPTDVLLIREALEGAKVLVHLTVAEDGEKALDYLRRRGCHAGAPRPDLILLDLNLPRKDGREVLEEVKRDERLRLIPVIVITTSSAQEDIERSYRDHANAFITKPVDFAGFVQAVRTIERFWFAVVTLPGEGVALPSPEQRGQPRGERDRADVEIAELLDAVSHDLREPVRGILGTARLLRERYAGRFDANAAELLRHTTDNAERLEQMLHGVLALSRIKTHSGPHAPIAADACLDAAIARLATQIDASGAVITRGELPIVTADRDQLTTVFEQLLRNAIEFRKEGAPPRIDVTAERESGASVFRVRDEGIGIDPRHAARIFGVFQRLHTRDEHPGVGIGLALCKAIVERHGGTIDVAAEPGQGPVFRFRIPDAA